MSVPDDEGTQASIRLAPGTMVQRYRIIERIGGGGMGEVYLALDPDLDRKVALKFLLLHFCPDSGCRARFKREAQAAARVDHPNVVSIHEVGEHQGRPFFSMQYLEGKTLQERREDRSLEEVIRLVLQVAEGLVAAHALGVVHRDIKPANIIVGADGRPRIVDFGLAAVAGADGLTRSGSTLGTIAYMSPEQAQGREVDARSDIFSLGVVLHELITGQSPFRRAQDAATLHAIVFEKPEPLARRRADVPAVLQEVVDRALAKDPEDRTQSAAEFRDALQALLETVKSEGTGSSVPSSVRSPLPSRPARPSIAVLPLTNMSADPENEYFADGLTEELINVLARNPGLKVTGRTSSFVFKSERQDLRDISRKLGVETLLEGSVRRAGDRVRIAVQLVSGRDGFHLWSEVFDRVLEDIFAVQDSIAGEVARALQVTLLGERTAEPVVVPESYALTLRAQQSALQRTPQGWAVATELYQKALDLDPQNARAWAGYAHTLAGRAFWGNADAAAVLPSAREAARKALELDGSSARAHAVMGFILFFGELRFEEGGREWRRAADLAPRDSAAILFLATYETFLGRFDEAVRLADLALEFDPLNPEAFSIRGRALLFSGRPAEACREYRRALELSPGMTPMHASVGFALLLEGRLEEALAESERERSKAYRSCCRAMVCHALGRRGESDLALEDLLREGDAWGMQQAQVYAFRREKDEAFERLERSCLLRDPGIALSRVHPLLKNLHDDPRWPGFLQRNGLAV